MTVDDSRLVRSIITASLGEHGFDTVEAENGEEALAFLEQQTVDLVLLDVMMPVMDGPGFLAALREKGSELPVILLTSKTETSIIAKCMKFGIEDYIVKPVKTEELCTKVSRVVGEPTEGGENAAEGEAETEDESAKEKVDILLVDDSEKVHQKFESMLPDSMTSRTCVSGQEAVKLAEELKFSAILIDMVIPGEDAVDIAGALKKELPDAQYLALFLRNVVDPMTESHNVGFDGFLVKPFQQDQVSDLVRVTKQTVAGPLDDILVVDENVLKAQPGGDAKQEQAYYSRMAELVGEAIEQLASDCFEDVTIDYSDLPASELLPMLVSVSMQCCNELGLEARVVGGEEIQKAIEAAENVGEVQVFPTLAEAQAAAS